MAKIGESVSIKKVAITGVPGSGKSTVAAIFGELGAYRIDTDKIAHRLLDQDSQLQRKIKDAFGQEIFSGELRKNLAEVVFSDPKKIEELEKLIHPKILHVLLNEMKEAEKNQLIYVAEVPLLFEINWDKHFDVTLCITANPSLCLSRSGMTEGEYNRRMKRQLSQAEKAQRADYVIENNRDLVALKTEIEELGIK
ncbi:MAG: dephospho-CoA kinase [Chlamydiales bacterium]